MRRWSNVNHVYEELRVAFVSSGPHQDGPLPQAHRWTLGYNASLPRRCLPSEDDVSQFGPGPCCPLPERSLTRAVSPFPLKASITDRSRPHNPIFAIPNFRRCLVLTINESTKCPLQRHGLPMLRNLPLPLHAGVLVRRVGPTGADIGPAGHGVVDEGLLLFLEQRDQLLLRPNCPPSPAVRMIDEPCDCTLFCGRGKWNAEGSECARGEFGKRRPLSP